MAKLTSPTLPTGTLIAVYEIKDVINIESSSILYHAWNEHLNTMVILKEYFPSDYAVRDVDGKAVIAKSNKDESIFKYGMEKFLELAEQLEDIQHPNIISVHNVLQFNGTAYLAMDFVHGTPLSKIHEGASHSFSDEKSKQTLHSLLNGLQTLHNKNNVHGDINPSNIIISMSGEPVLVNFASASIALSDYIQQHTSQEEANPPKETLSSSNSDLYGLGSSLFFCITGHDSVPLIDRQTTLNKNQPDPCQTALDHIKTESNESLLKTIRWMLNIDPQQRPQSAQEVLTEMDQGSIESNNQKGAINSSDQPLTALILTGLAACLALIAGSVWFFTQQPSPEKTIIASNSIEQEVIAKDKQTKKSTAKYLSEESETTTALAEFEKPNTKKINLPDSTTSALKSNDLITPKEQEKIPPTKLEVSKGNSAPLPPSENSTEIAPDHQENIELTIEQKEKIIRHLAAAKKNVELLNFTTPTDNNAYDQYQAVLSINKENTEATEGLQQIFNIYIGYIEKAIKDGKFATAATYIRRAESIQANTPEIQYLREKLRKHKEKPQKENVFLQGSVV
ncbi:MAG: protein kinase [Methylococcaceae bacterium]